MTDVDRMRVGERWARCWLTSTPRCRATLAAAEVTTAADAGDGQRNPGLDRAATRPRRTPRRRGELG
jgi:hypothetical protein